MMTLNLDPEVWLRLALLTDSALPVGAFSHSYGLETYVAHGLVRGPEQVAALLLAVLEQGLARVDGPAVALAHRAAAARDVARLSYLDELTGALRLPREWREAGMQVGRRLLTLGSGLWPHDPALAGYARAVAAGEASGHHPVAAGAVYHEAGVPAEAAVLSYLYAAVQGLVSAAVRLVPLGQTQGQRLLVELMPHVVAAARQALATREEELGGFLPALEVRGMQHERLYTRLFVS